MKRRLASSAWRLLQSSKSLMLILLIILIPGLLIMAIMSASDPDSMSDTLTELSLSSRVAEMSDRIRHAEMLNRERKSELILLRHRLDQLEQQSSHGENNDKKYSEPLTPDSFLLHQSNLVTDSIQVPSLLSFLPHLMHENASKSWSSDPLRPAFIRRSSSRGARSDVSIVIGIPTVRRPIESYLLSTITNLIDNMSPGEMEKTLVIVFIAETDMDFVLQTSNEISDMFDKVIESGLLEIVSPPSSYYPDLSQLTATLGDNIDRTRWRTKQNLDFAYLMMFCQPRGTYFVMLEDDILSKPSFVSKMLTFAYKQSQSKDWLILDFCQLGFIGKMFKSTDLSMFSLMFLMFRNDKPVDWILTDVAKLKYCRADQDAKECRKMLSTHWLFSRPSLFQHVGTHSSLKGKVQKLKDKNFGKVKLFRGHPDNPPAVLSTSLRIYKEYSLDAAYRGDNFFWAYEPSARDHLVINFTRVGGERVTGFLFRSGDGEHPEDRFPVNTTIEVLPAVIHNVAADPAATTSVMRDNVIRDTHDDMSDGIHLVIKSLSGGTNSKTEVSSPSATSSITRRIDQSYQVVGLFKSNGIAEGEIPSGMAAIQSIRIRVSSDSQKWVILSEIWIKT